MNNRTDINPADQSSCPNAVSVFFTTAMATISLAAFTGNILVIYLVYKTPNLRTSTNYYYVNMAVSDFLASLTTWPLYLTDEIITSRGSVIQGTMATAGCKMGVFFRLVSTSVSILSLVLIAIDRFIATVFPLKASLISGKVRAALLSVIWLVSTAYCVPPFKYSFVETVGHETFCIFSWSFLAIMFYYIAGMALFNIMPLIAIIILYYRIMQVLTRRVELGTNTIHINTQQRRINKQNQNIMRIFKSVVLAFTVSFFFFCVYLTLKIISPELFIKDKCKWILGFSYYLFPSLSTAINPIILFVFSSNFRQALLNLCPCCFTKFRSFYKTRTSTITPCKEIENLAEVQL